MNNLGERIRNILQHLGEGALLFFQALYWSKAAPRNVDKIVAHLVEFGNATLPIASLMALFIGGVLALQTGSRLAQFGLEGNIGSIVGPQHGEGAGPGHDGPAGGGAGRARPSPPRSGP